MSNWYSVGCCTEIVNILVLTHIHLWTDSRLTPCCEFVQVLKRRRNLVIKRTSRLWHNVWYEQTRIPASPRNLCIIELDSVMYAGRGDGPSVSRFLHNRTRGNLQSEQCINFTGSLEPLISRCGVPYWTGVWTQMGFPRDTDEKVAVHCKQANWNWDEIQTTA